MDGDGSRDSIKQPSCFEIGIQKYKISDGCDRLRLSVADNYIKIHQKTYFNSKKKVKISSVLWS
jgi:hypothetical protein